MRITRQEDNDYALGGCQQNLRIGGRGANSRDSAQAYPLELGVILSRPCMGKPVG